MKPGTKGTVSIESFRNLLRIRLPRTLFNGQQKYISLGLTDTPRNRQEAKVKCEQIQLDILKGEFDYSLRKYKPTSFIVHTSTGSYIRGEGDLTLDKLWFKYISFKKPFVTDTYYNKDFVRITNHINRFPTVEIKDALLIQTYLLSTYSVDTAIKVLKQLKACCEWGVDYQLIDKNPYVNLTKRLRKTIGSKKVRKGINPFSKEEIKKILTAFRENTFCEKQCNRASRHSNYRDFVHFLFLTGCRPSEAIALKWKHIDRKFTRIVFEEAYVEGKRKCTKTGKPRTFPINNELKSLLSSVVPVPYSVTYSGEQLVFPSPLNKQEIDLHNFTNRVWQKVIKGLGIPYRSVYNIRHTFITSCIESGKVSVPQVASWVGNSPEILMKHYAGVIQHSEVPEIIDKYVF